MRLIVRDRITFEVYYLPYKAVTRGELARLIGSNWFKLKDKNYHIHEVEAIPDNSHTIVAIITGGLIGLIGGPIGFLLGLLFGTCIGLSKTEQENREALIFNESTKLETQNS